MQNLISKIGQLLLVKVDAAEARSRDHRPTDHLGREKEGGKGKKIEVKARSLEPNTIKSK